MHRALRRAAVGPLAAALTLLVPTASAMPFTVGIFERAGSIQFFPIFLTILGTGGVVVAAYASIAASQETKTRRRVKPKRKARPAARPARPAAKPPAPARKPPGRKAVALPATVRIGFPQIPDAYPEVWGVGEEIRIEVHARQPDGAEPAAGSRIRLAFEGGRGGNQEQILHTDPQGSAGLTTGYDAPQDLRLVARLVRDDQTVAQGRAELRIVDYRQEIVETFSDFQRFAAQQFPSLDPRATPREFCDRFADQNPRAPRSALDRLAYVLEISNYSDHPIDRSHFIEMVEAFLELEKAGVLGSEGQEA